jgi:branched-chain amino acid transport system permease protein
MKNRIVMTLLGLLLLGLPLVVSNAFFQHMLIMVLFSTLMGIAWNLLGGYGGQVSFGHAAFLGIGAYTTMIFYLTLEWSPWLGLLAGGVVSALVAIPIGLICFRLRGPYFSLATLAVAEIVRVVALNWESLTAGPQGLLITHLPPMTLFGYAVDWESKTPFYYLIVVLVMLAMLANHLMANSRLGAYLLAVREDMDCAEAAGINTVRTRVMALAFSAALAGLAGGFYGVYFRYVDPDAVFSVALSVEMVFIAVVGGIATTAGPIVGAVVLVTISELFKDRFQSGHLIFYGLFMMVIIRYLPEGIWGKARMLLGMSGSGREAAK